VKEMLSNPLLVTYSLVQRTANGTNTESGVNAVLLVVAELILGREQRSKKPNMAGKIVLEKLEKRPLATHITVQLIVNMKHGEIGPLAQNHATVENRPDREESKLLLRLGEQNALEIARKHNLVIPKNVQLPVNGTNGAIGILVV